MNIPIPEVVKSTLEANNIAYVYYDSTGLVNAIDKRNVTQSYYCTTGTAVFRASNDRYEKRRVTKRCWTIADFVKALKEPII